ncbi:MAG: cyanophycinase [Planctomycetota bacterium]|jgi:cyanophycinase
MQTTDMMNWTRIFWTVCLLSICISPSLSNHSSATSVAAGKPGYMIIVGGGGTTPAIQGEVARLLGKDFHVAIMPQASEREDRGKPSADMWTAAGAKHVFNLIDLRAPKTREKLKQADLIWMPGGAQSKLVEAIEAADLASFLRARHKAGTMIGGTSAGAAVFGELMIAGSPDPASLRCGAMKPLLGLGIWPEAVIDQHFIARNRGNRLLTAVLDHPQKLGIGIDERTAVIQRGNELRVIGDGCVIVYDARQAKVTPAKKGAQQSATGLEMQILADGATWSWRKTE